MYIKTQKFLILGISKSGLSASSFLLEHGAKCYIYEENFSGKIDDAKKQLVERGAIDVKNEDIYSVLELVDIVVLSPGVPINHPISVKAKSLNKRIIGELEFGFALFNPTTIAVTGTNGKTTTCSLINAILKTAQIKCSLVGNVGVPITQKIPDISFDSVCVAEVSSFQLETVVDFLPHISCVLNISPDHLERHYSMDNYVFLKKRIMANQKESEYVLLNYDDEIVRNFAKDSKAKTLFVSLKNKVDGAYLRGDKFYYNDEEILERGDVTLIGEHNYCNVLFAILCAKLMGVENSIIKQAIVEFKGVEHRMQTVAENDGIKYINDSKATNTASTLSAIKSMDRPTVLIIGGSEKGESYDNLFEQLKCSIVKHVVITGASRFNMLSSAGAVGYTNVTVTPDFDFAVKIASKIAEDGDCVLLSPACASFDRFSGYEERGLHFISIVENMI